MSGRQRFETLVLPHLDAAYNLARWLLRDEPAAEDAVQEASMRAFRYIDSLRGDDPRPWWLGIVRNTCFTMLERRRNIPETVEFDDAEFEAAARRRRGRPPRTRRRCCEQRRLRTLIDAAIRALSPALREVIVLREFEDLDYAQIAKIVAVPVGTVMSRLSRAREKMREALMHSHLAIQPGALTMSLDDQDLSALIRQHATRHTAPDSLRAGIRTQIGAGACRPRQRAARAPKRRTRALVHFRLGHGLGQLRAGHAVHAARAAGGAALQPRAGRSMPTWWPTTCARCRWGRWPR